MTRILALGDTQLGVQTVTLESQAQVLERIADVAIEQQVDLVLHGGDVFEGPVVLPEQMRVFLDFALRLIHDEIPLIVLRGNGRHDMATRDVHALDVLSEIRGITVSDRAENLIRGHCVISTLPWTKLARENDGAAHLVRIAAHLRETESYANEFGWPHILALHWSISGASLPTGLPVDQLREPVIEWADLDTLGFDCVIASHIHKPQRLDDPALGDATMGIYTGSPQPLNHGEAGFEHGCWLIDVESGACSLDFIEIASPQFVTFDIENTERFLPQVLGDVDAWERLQGGIVRLRYTATREQDAAIDKNAIRRELETAGAARVDFRPVITREVRARVETMTEDLSPLNALSLYCETQDTDIALRNRMLLRLGEWIA